MTSDNADTTPDASKEPTISRRDLLAAVAGAGVGAAGAAAVAQESSAAPQGRVGTPSAPLAAVHVAELRGPIVDQGTAITQLPNIRVEEDSTTLAGVDPNTLVIRYDPNSTT
jgi:hypothetical protein